MANKKILEQKQVVIDEIKEKFQNAKSIVLFDPRGLNVSEVTELRRALRESGSDYKVYKNSDNRDYWRINIIKVYNRFYETSIHLSIFIG